MSATLAMVRAEQLAALGRAIAGRRVIDFERLLDEHPRCSAADLQTALKAAGWKKWHSGRWALET